MIYYGTRLLPCLLLVVVLLNEANSEETPIRVFNNLGFDYSFSGFTQTLSQDSVRLFDTSDGWGGAGFQVNSGIFNGQQDNYLSLDITPSNEVVQNSFEIELIQDSTLSGEVNLSGKWQFDLSSLQPGVRATYVSNTPLSNPTSGIGNFGSLNLDLIEKVQILGEFNSSTPFDLDIHKISIEDDVTPPEEYVGRSLTSPWRSVAETKIDQLRKSQINLKVLDANGVAVPNASISVEMQEHEFKFGSAVQAHRLRNPSTDLQYKAKVEELFNVVTLENNLKWPAWEGEWGSLFTQSGAQNALSWLADRNIDARGHAMIWPGEENLPQDIQNMLSDNNLNQQEQNAVRQRIDSHIENLSNATTNNISVWDVINETRTNSDLMDLLDEGDAAMIDWFAKARMTNPGDKLHINDFGILSSNESTTSTNQNTYFQTINYLLSNNAEIDGIGMQAHFTEADLTGPENLWTILDRFESLGLDIHITEYDFNSTDETLQADYMRDFLTAIFAHESIDSFSLWGFWEGAHWRLEAALFRQNWDIKPNGQAFIDLVYGDWWTDESMVADADGEATLRGFKGEYLATATVGNKTSTISFNANQESTEVVVTLDFVVGDYNGDGQVSAADYTVWRDNLGSTVNLSADGDNNGVVDINDYLIWSNNFNASSNVDSQADSVPEASTFVYAFLLITTTLTTLR